MVEDKTYLCRCEDLTKKDLHKILEKHKNITLEEIKRLTRATMGPCQGRTCKKLIAREIARFKGEEMSEVGLPTYRAPINPIKLGKVDRGKENEE
ncbi:(2Fe-2S)-binding protein [Candidatus Bipolaricaulota bacterium]|nr:(2Fe-2S)-binding protein [Candidatus Bipolaricaulota bacterium]MBS3792616.1 (2Fe-2S)-binding protein [Candidatus Bipolaricaulota bacterium]